MAIRLTAADAASHSHRLLPVFQGAGEPFAGLPPEIGDPARALARVRGFGARPEQTLLLPLGAAQWLFVGMGEPAALTPPRFGEGVARAFAELRKANGLPASLELPAALPWPVAECARLAAEALHMAAYTFEVYRSKAAREPAAPAAPGAPAAPEPAPELARAGEATAAAAPEPALELVRAGEGAALAAGIAQGTAVGAAIALTRDLINQPAGVAHTDFLVEQARQVARTAGADYREIRGDLLRSEGYGAIHGVGQAAEHPPALVAIEYGRQLGSTPLLAIVGKGVVFDTGGLDLKSSSGMALMKKDMSGAAIALGALQAIAALKLPVHVVAVLGLAENAVGPRAYRPGDILKSKQGTTIEITNTDAEGRVVLADALALAREYQPSHIVDFATLTGACRTALGKELMGLFCDDEALRAALVASAAATGEHVWPLPLWAPYRKKLESAVADLVNAAADGQGGAITAALFLKEFAGTVAWAHLDCYSWSEGEHPLFPKGGSGIGVRLMIDLIHRLNQGR
ncbi:MAG: leucyl aminopeptidase family protein [Candidatus Lambdaproteobacteria bacterium]|nr:leucyl aminopeptidase family protein [Candidatus Lambdaproteobacteria bacterium]